jgi:hypothetical protein
MFNVFQVLVDSSQIGSVAEHLSHTNGVIGTLVDALLRGNLLLGSKKTFRMLIDVPDKIAGGYILSYPHDGLLRKFMIPSTTPFISHRLCSTLDQLATITR